jgi:putative ABC transport system permease protein
MRRGALSTEVGFVRLARLAWSYLWARPLVAALNLAMVSLGVGAMVLVTLVSEQLEHRAQRDVAGIDLVVGAKGSPLQLILAGVFHVDVPTGNVPWATLAQLREHPLVAQAVPLSLGDAVQGHRIVGTERDYAQWYGAELAAGRWWNAPMQAVLGAQAARATGLQPGGSFVGTHGLGASGEVHAEAPYTVTGVLRDCGCVLDRLVLTATESVWVVHEKTTLGEGASAEDRAALAAERETTLLLVRYRTPLAAVTLPRWVNAQAGLQAGVPALEAARLFRNLGVGLDLMRAFAAAWLVMAALSIFVALAHAVREREPDLAMLRMLGAPPGRVAALVAWEALWLAALGVLAGLLAGHLATHLLGWISWDGRSLPLTGLWVSPQEPLLAAGVFALALLAVALPTWRVLRLDVTMLLQAPR